jgi:ligand-binding SRPBCC domain-containing protein
MATTITAPVKVRRFQKRSVMPTTMDRMIAFHEGKDAFKTLTPFPIIAQIHDDRRTSITAGEIDFTLWFGPIPARWTAQHEPGPIPTSFADRMVKGPLKAWRHEHIFREVPGGIELTDSIVFEHFDLDKGFWAVFTRLFMDTLGLNGLFFYRHMITRIKTKQDAR